MRLDFDRRTKEEIARRCGFDVHVRLARLQHRADQHDAGHVSGDRQPQHQRDQKTNVCIFTY